MTINPATSFELKIRTLEGLRQIRMDRYAQWNKVVLAHGCFDLLHPGHLEHLKQAREMGDTLVVSITADAYVGKGPGRPIFPQNKRAAMLAALDFVSAVAIVDSPTALPVIEVLKPEVYAKGEEYRNCEAQTWADECAAVTKHGGKVQFTTGETASSSTLVNSYLSTWSKETQQFVNTFKTKHTLSDVLRWLDMAQEVKASVIGEPILDEYIFVKPRGKSRKDSIVLFEQVAHAYYAGGAEIVAAHAGQICQSVFINHDVRRITKTRYVLEPFQVKQFYVCDCGEAQGALPDPQSLHGLTIVADFGHGLISPCYASSMKESEFIALTCQTNSLNFGFNLLTKWSRANYVVCDEDELRLSCADAMGDIAPLAHRERVRMGATLLAVTLGHNGCLIVGDNISVSCPALADKVIDRTGAGDAFLGYTAPLAYLGAPADIIALVGSIASAIKVGILGNKVVEREAVIRWLKAMLK